MRPENQSERQSAILRFWAIYIVVLIIPMVAFFYIFRNSGGNSKDYDSLQRQIKEFERLSKLTIKLDSLSKKIISTDLEIIKPNTRADKLVLREESKQIVKNMETIIDNMDRSKKEATSEAVRIFIVNIKTFLNNYLSYHNAFIEKVDFETDNTGKDNELAQLKLENGKINGELGQMKAQVDVLRDQLSKCK